MSGGTFEHYIQHLYTQHYHCVSLSNILCDVHRRRPWPLKTIALTFDDGYEDFLTLALPLLCRYNFPATIFIVTDLVGKKSNWEGESGTPLLSWDEIKRIHEAGMAFGSHTCSHPRLPNLPEKQIWHELTDSRERLEDKLSHEILALAYPHGESNSKIQQLAQASGYQMACGLMKGKNGFYNLSRRSCGAADDLQALVYKSSNRYGLRKWFRDDTRIGQVLYKITHYSKRDRYKSL